MDWQKTLAKFNKEKEFGDDIKGDGNCFYRCLAEILYGSQERHKRIRQEIIQYMSDDEWMTKEEKINRYRKFMTKNDCYDDYLTLHSNIGKWAEDVIIQASADKYCLHIFVSFYTNHNEVIRTVAKPVQAERGNYKRIFLKLENGHYTIISKDLKVSPEEPWFDLLGPPADGPEQYEYSSLALDYNKCFTKQRKYEQIYNLKYIGILRDENSFLRCLSYLLNGDQDKHDQIRMKIIKFMSNDKLLSKADKLKRYGKLMDENVDYNSYLELHSQNNELADDPIMQASADRYGLDIYVYFYRNSNCIQRMRAKSLQPRTEDNMKIFLKFEDYYFSFAEDQYELPDEDWFDLLFSLEDGTEKFDECESLDLDNWKNIILYGYRRSNSLYFDRIKEFEREKIITKELKKKWNFKVFEEPTWDVNYIANHIADENLPGKNGSA